MTRARRAGALAGMAVAVAALAALLAGCGSSSGSTGSPSPKVAPAQTTHLNALRAQRERHPGQAG